MALSSTVVCLLASLCLLSAVGTGAGMAPQRVRPQDQRAATYPARQFGLTATQPKTARLMANSEAQEDLDDAAEEVEVTQPSPAAVPRPVPAAPVTPTIAYYPAGAVGFVRPTAFARFIDAPQQAAFVAQPPYYAAYFG
ncbi:uncharacterized protein LOC108030773 [Drosophila biarmipes]|uniref:uncharacterized protein LOC108030773 n=1 Tax=Drosophila biarmipes TaxID=125945 RepID=UPI0007E68823|nr:uncharacterized protein LOC108030773 [Drosophila biarmipes]